MTEINSLYESQAEEIDPNTLDSISALFYNKPFTDLDAIELANLESHLSVLANRARERSQELEELSEQAAREKIRAINEIKLLQLSWIELVPLFKEYYASLSIVSKMVKTENIEPAMNIVPTNQTPQAWLNLLQIEQEDFYDRSEKYASGLSDISPGIFSPLKLLWINFLKKDKFIGS